MMSCLMADAYKVNIISQKRMRHYEKTIFSYDTGYDFFVFHSRATDGFRR